MAMNLDQMIGLGFKMRILIVILFIAMIAFASRTAQEGPCPHKDVIFPVGTPFGLIPVEMEKDFFNKDTEGKDWMDAKEYNELMEEEEPIEEEQFEEENETKPI